MTSEQEFEVNHLAEANTQWRKYSNRQKQRIKFLEMTLKFIKDHFEMNDLDKAMPRVYEEIVESLEDKQRKAHNTSCTYQFELAFHHLKDTPELRKLYWSAMGAIQFDDKDQVVTPELVECPVCKEGEHV